MEYIKKLIQEALLMEGVASVEDVNNAINNLTQVEIRYLTNGKTIATGRRIIYPVAYGLTKSGNPVIRAFEPYGDTSSKVPAWKFFRLDRIKNWRPLKKSYKGEKLEGFNENGDETMSVVYNIANIKGRPSNIIFPKIGKTPLTKDDVLQQSSDTLRKGEKYGSEDVVKDLMRFVPQDEDPLNGIKQQIEKPKQMVSPEIMKQIEKDNARKKLAQARKQGIKLDNEEELVNLVKGRENYGPVTKNDIKKGTVPSNNPGALTKQDIEGQNYEITNDDLNKIKQQWGLS